MSKKTNVFILFLLIQVAAFSQKDFNKYADKLFDAGAYNEAAPMYLSMLQQAYDYENNFKLAVCLKNLNRVNEAEYWYGVLAEQKSGDADILYNYAQLLKLNGKYKTAKEWFLEYAQFNEDGYYLAGTCDYAMGISEKLSAWAIDTLSINTSGSETAPAYYRSGIVYASTGISTGDKKQKINPASGLPFYDLYYAAQGSDNNLRNPTELDGVNTDMHEASAFFDTNSNTLFFTRNNYYKGRQLKGKDDAVHLQIFTTLFADGKFQKAKPFQFISKEYSIGQPCLSPDGNILIFTSDMPGGFGGTDLYYAEKLEEGWSLPINMGAVINSKGNEMFPFISDEGKLYFSSNWHPGLGGYDIFISERNAGNWTKPENLGTPVNSSRDDMAFIIHNGVGYFSSNRPGGKGSDDIYRCIQLQEIETLHIQNSKLQDVIGAQVTVYAGDRIDTNGYTNVLGMFPVALQENTEYSLTVEKEGYLETNVQHVEQFQSNNGILPVHLQELFTEEQNENIIIEETPEENLISDESQEIIPEEKINVDESSAIPNEENTAEIVSATSFANDNSAAQQNTETAIPETTSPPPPVIEPVPVLPAEDVIIYEVQLGVFRTPDYSKIDAFKKFGEVNSVKKDDGTTRVSITKIITLDDAQALQKEAIEKGFAGAYIITYKNGVRIN